MAIFDTRKMDFGNRSNERDSEKEEKMNFSEQMKGMKKVPSKSGSNKRSSAVQNTFD